MADESIYATKGALKIERSGVDNIREDDYEWRTINGSGAKIGKVVTETGETYPDVALAVTTDRPYGIIAAVDPALSNSSYTSIDSGIPDNTRVKVLKFRNQAIGATVLTFYAPTPTTAVDLAKGDLLTLSSEAGNLIKFVYTDAAAATDTTFEVVASSADDVTGSTSDELVIEVRI